MIETGSSGVLSTELSAYIERIDRFNAAQRNAAFLDELRRYNHLIIDELNKIRPLSGIRLLDIGASPHGYSLERALSHSVGEYVGVGLDIEERGFELRTPSGHGKLLRMNAEALDLPDESFHAVVSMSTFEHIANVPAALDEIRRVLLPGGCALITFEPIWTCSYGHHLHHFGDIHRVIPDWAHLIWTPQEMIDNMRDPWPSGAPIGLEQAVAWTYQGREINRIGITELRRMFADWDMKLEWCVELKDSTRSETQLIRAQSATGLTRDDLLTKGLSLLCTRR